MSALLDGYMQRRGTMMRGASEYLHELWFPLQHAWALFALRTMHGCHRDQSVRPRESFCVALAARLPLCRCGCKNLLMLFCQSKNNCKYFSLGQFVLAMSANFAAFDCR